MQLQERTLNTAAGFVNAFESVEMQARLVLVQPAKQLQVCVAGKAAWLVNAVAYERKCTRQSCLVQSEKQLKVCVAGKAARLVNAVAYVAMRECTRRSRLV